MLQGNGSAFPVLTPWGSSVVGTMDVADARRAGTLIVPRRAELGGTLRLPVPG